MSYALDRINEILRIQAAVTVRGDEVRCYVPSDVGIDKAYLGADQCDALGEAFVALAAELRSSHAKEKG